MIHQQSDSHHHRIATLRRSSAAATPMMAPSAIANTASGGPLSLPPPRFTAALRVHDDRGFMLVSQATGRSWRAIDSLKECQFGEVLRSVEVTKAGTHAQFAIKELSLRKIREMLGRTHEDPLREVSALQYLSCEWHPNVLECTEALRDDESIYIVTPFYGKGELFDLITDRGPFGEAEARPLFRQVLDGLYHLKRHGVCHRDLSLENVLMDEGKRVKLIDFGLALRIPQTADGRARALVPQGPCGKQLYISPEVLTSSGGFDGFAVDVWACGVMLFIMLTGVPPFEVALPSQDHRCRVIAMEERLAELLSAWRMPLSLEVIDFIQSCLLFDPERRPTLETLRNHPWITA